MSALPAERADLLNRVLALTPAGQRELRDPRAGLSLPQRWLLVHVDGESSLADIAEASAGTAQVNRLPRDAARLVSMGMAFDVGEPGPSEFGATTQQGDFAATVMSPALPTSMAPSASRTRSTLPLLALGGALALAGMGAGYLMWSPRSAFRPGAQPMSAAPAATGAPVTNPPALALPRADRPVSPRVESAFAPARARAQPATLTSTPVVPPRVVRSDALPVSPPTEAAPLPAPPAAAPSPAPAQGITAPTPAPQPADASAPNVSSVRAEAALRSE